MTNPRPTPKRFRPRFSIRTLAIVVTLVCCYAACWGPTKKVGVADVIQHVNSVPWEASWDGKLDAVASATMPLVVEIDVPESASASVWAITGRGQPLESQIIWSRRHYYFWFFGYVAKLPQ